MNEQPVSRREFMKVTAAAGAVAAVPGLRSAFAQTPFHGKLPKAHCRTVVNADTLVVDGIGNIALLGIRGPAKGSPGYQKAVDALVKYAENKEILVDLGPKRTQTADGRFRAVVYFEEDGAWYNLNTKMLRAGLASAVTEPQCHVDTSGWVELVREAKSKARGLYHLGLNLPETAPPVALAPETRPRPVVVRRRPRPGGGKGPEADLPAYRRTYVAPKPVSVEVRYLGSIRSNRFHRPTCPLVPRELDRVLFEGRLQALKKGFKPCLVCRP